MKSYTLGLYEKAMPGELSWREKLTAAKNAGFDFIEISIDETDEKLRRLDMSQSERMGLIELMMEIGVPIRSMCLSGHRKYPFGSKDERIRARSMEIMEKAIRLAEDLGIRIIQLAGYDVYYEDSTPESKAWFARNLKEAVLMAAGAGVLLGFETMETEFMNTVEKAMNYVSDMKSVYLSVYPDAGNITNAAASSGTDVLADIRAGAGHTAAMHLKETVPGVFREVPFGNGHVAFESMISAAWNIGVRRFVTEFWYTGDPLWEKDLVYAYDLMSGILEKQSRCSLAAAE